MGLWKKYWSLFDDYEKRRQERIRKRKEFKKNGRGGIIGKGCSECRKFNPVNANYCIHCGHKLKKIPVTDKAYYIYCTECGSRMEKDDIYCGECGHKRNKKIEKRKVCPVCGEWNNLALYEKYCWNCGHDKIDLKKRGDIGFNFLSDKICPNCGTQHYDMFSYCEQCGTKLDKKRSIIDELKRGWEAGKR